MSLLSTLKGLKVTGVVLAHEDFDDCLIFENGLCLFLSKWEPAPLEEAKEVIGRQVNNLEKAANSYKSFLEASMTLKGIEEARDKERQEELKAQEILAAAQAASQPVLETQGDLNGSDTTAGEVPPTT